MRHDPIKYTDNKELHKKAFKTAYQHIIKYVLVVCTSLSVTSSPSFQILRQPVRAIFEEVGRATDRNFTRFLSSHSDVSLCLVAGDQDLQDSALSLTILSGPMPSFDILASSLYRILRSWVEIHFKLHEINSSRHFLDAGWRSEYSRSPRFIQPRDFERTKNHQLSQPGHTPPHRRRRYYYTYSAGEIATGSSSGYDTACVIVHEFSERTRQIASY